MAYDDDKLRLIENSKWYNEFFDALHHILAKTAKALADQYDRKMKVFYYPKANDRPGIPAYYMLGLGGASSIQVFIVLDPQIMEDQPAFRAEPSVIVVKHSRGDRYGYVLDYGLRIIRNGDIVCKEVIVRGKSWQSGEILAGEGKGTKFHAFQVSLDPFISPQDLDRAITEHIVSPLKDLPAL